MASRMAADVWAGSEGAGPFMTGIGPVASEKPCRPFCQLGERGTQGLGGALCSEVHWAPRALGTEGHSRGGVKGALGQ